MRGQCSLNGLLFILIFICVASRTSQSITITRFRFLDIRFSKVYSITCSFIIIIRIHLENRTDAKIGIFPIPIVYWSGFGIFKQNWENPNTTKTVGQSPYVAIFFSSYKKMFSKIRINLLAICQDSCRVVPNFYVRVLGC